MHIDLEHIIAKFRFKEVVWFTMNQRLVQQQIQWFSRFTWFSVAVSKSYDIHIDFIHEITKSRFKEFVWFVTHCLVQNESTLVTRP